MRPESWVLSSRENRATGGSPEPGHVTLDDFSCGQETSLALLVRHGDGASAADVIRRFLKPAHDPAIVHSQRRAHGSTGFRLRARGALAQLRGELA